MSAYADKLAAKVEALKAKTRARATNIFKAFVLDAYRRIVLKTPVDTGRAKNNWFVGIEAPDVKTTTAVSPTGAAGNGRATIAMRDFRLGAKVYITNSLPYIRVLEYGEYPNPPKRGSRVKGKGWVVKTVDGFSRQAPAGMVGVTMAEMRLVGKAIAVQSGLQMSGVAVGPK